MKKIKNVAYFGFSKARAEDTIYKEALACAKFLSEKGYVCVNGGGPGLMRATSEGAKEGKGMAVGVTFYPKDAVSFEGRDPDNPLDLEVKTKNYLERTLKLLELGDVYVVFKGGTGTISEFAMAWGLAKLYFGHHKPLILYGGFWDKIIEAFKKNMMIMKEDLAVFRIAKTPEEAYRAILEFEEEIRIKNHSHLSEAAFEL